jgi:hypothetical protein
LHDSPRQQTEREKLNQLAIHTLCFNKNLFALENCEHAVRLVRSLGIFFFTSSKTVGADHFTDLFNSMSEMMINANSTLIQQQIACQSMAVILGSLNKNPFEGGFFERPWREYADMLASNMPTSIQIIDQLALALGNRNCKIKNFSKNQKLEKGKNLKLPIQTKNIENQVILWNFGSCFSVNFFFDRIAFLWLNPKTNLEFFTVLLTSHKVRIEPEILLLDSFISGLINPKIVFFTFQVKTMKPDFSLLRKRQNSLHKFKKKNSFRLEKKIDIF